MKASELIQRLEWLKENYGDIDVRFKDSEYDDESQKVESVKIKNEDDSCKNRFILISW